MGGSSRSHCRTYACIRESRRTTHLSPLCSLTNSSSSLAGTTVACGSSMSARACTSAISPRRAKPCGRSSSHARYARSCVDVRARPQSRSGASDRATRPAYHGEGEVLISTWGSEYVARKYLRASKVYLQLFVWTKIDFCSTFLYTVSFKVKPV
jgi:hypothetical protein